MDPMAVGDLERDVRFLVEQPRHRAVPESLSSARDYCAGQLRAAGWSVACEPFSIAPNRLRILRDRAGLGEIFGRLEGVNVIATRTAARTDAPPTLLVAHLDSVRSSPGADDNASGVAVVLDVARRLSEQANVMIALLDLEEVGLLGSRHLVRTCVEPPAQVICLESVGYFDDHSGSQRLPAGFGVLFPDITEQIRQRGQRGDFLAIIHRGDMPRIVEGLTTQSRGVGGVEFLELRDRRWNGRGQHLTRWAQPILMDLDRSDHAPFWRARVPSLMITDTAPLRNPAYHRPADTPDTLDYPRMAALSRGLSRCLPLA